MNWRDKHKTPRQLGLTAPYQFPDMTLGRVAERGVQYLPRVSTPYPKEKLSGLGAWPSDQ